MSSWARWWVVLMVGGSDNVKVEQSDRSMVEPMVAVMVAQLELLMVVL